VHYYNITVLSHAQIWYVLNKHKKLKHCKQQLEKKQK